MKAYMSNRFKRALLDDVIKNEFGYALAQAAKSSDPKLIDDRKTPPTVTIDGVQYKVTMVSSKS